MTSTNWLCGAALAFLGALCWCAPQALQAQDAEPIVPAAVLRTLSADAGKLAKKGRRADVEELLTIAAELGESETKLAKTRAACDKSLAKAKKVAASVPDVSKSLERAVGHCVAALAELKEERRTALATQILRLDADCVPAREALGHVQHRETWVPAELLPMLERRDLIRAKSQEARRLPVNVKIGESGIPVLKTLYGKPGHFAECQGYSFHAVDVTEAKCARMLTHALRALAFSHWLCNGELAIPPVPEMQTFVLINDPHKYKAAVEEAGQSGGMDKTRFEWVKSIHARAFWDTRRHNTGTAYIESTCEVWMMHYGFERLGNKQYGKVPQPPLAAGHLNWLAMEFLGTALYTVGFTEDEVTRHKRGTAGSEVETVERERMLKLAKAGLVGTHAYLRWAAKRGEDPAWSRCVVDQMGRINGFDRLKATSMAAFLHESNRFADLLAKTAQLPPENATFEDALGQSLGELEADWRAWLFADVGEPGLVQRLDAPVDTGLTPDQKKLLDHLNGLRKGMVPSDCAEFVEQVGLDEDLSAGALLHAAYLNRHPEQAQAWPDAHEEYPDKEGFTAKGAWAGLRAVIDPGSDGPERSIDAWMATFYHRIPLLDPGLLRVGWAREKQMAVLDVTSLVLPLEHVVYSMWPRPESKDVPLRFAPELPNPVPGEDQSTWGYPITLQFSDVTNERDVRLQLFAGSPDAGAELPCHFSSPQVPTNARLAPRGVFCLIPKAHLKPMTTYTVVATGMPDDDEEKTREVRWSFTTGR